MGRWREVHEQRIERWMWQGTDKEVHKGLVHTIFGPRLDLFWTHSISILLALLTDLCHCDLQFPLLDRLGKHTCKEHVPLCFERSCADLTAQPLSFGMESQGWKALCPESRHPSLSWSNCYLASPFQIRKPRSVFHQPEASYEGAPLYPTDPMAPWSPFCCCWVQRFFFRRYHQISIDIWKLQGFLLLILNDSSMTGAARMRRNGWADRGCFFRSVLLRPTSCRFFFFFFVPKPESLISGWSLWLPQSTFTCSLLVKILAKS